MTEIVIFIIGNKMRRNRITKYIYKFGYEL